MKTRIFAFLASLFCCFLAEAAASSSTVESLTFSGSADTNQATFSLTGKIKGTAPENAEPKLIYSVHETAMLRIDTNRVSQTIEAKTRVAQGKFRELIFTLHSDGKVEGVTGEDVRDWSIRFGEQDARSLVIRLKAAATNAPPREEVTMRITAAQNLEKLPATNSLLSLVPEAALFFDGSLEVTFTDALEVTVTNLTGLSPVQFPGQATNSKPQNFVFSNQKYGATLELREKDPDARKATLENFSLTGTLTNNSASFVLTGTVNVKHPEGGSLPILSGAAALTTSPTNGEITYEGGQYVLRFRKPGSYPIALNFNAKITQQENWNAINFDVAASSLRPVRLFGLPADTQFEFVGAAKPERRDGEFACYLPATGGVQMRWKQAKAEEIGKLFFSAQDTGLLEVSPGLVRSIHIFEIKVMQGELNQVTFDLLGDGDVSRVTGENILGWKIGTAPDKSRHLIVQLNQSRKDNSTIAIQTQSPVGAFPSRIQPLRITPVGAIRFAGNLLVVNNGAVRLEVTETRGLSQISPELFPKVKELGEIAAAQRTQSFAYRFSSTDFALTIQADNILPELSVSEILLYSHGETESTIDAELELEIREAPLREFIVKIPSDYTVSRVSIAQLSDYNIAPAEESGWSKLRISFTTPLIGRQIAQLRLEKNQNLKPGKWVLPTLQPQNAKSVRGYVGISTEIGLHVTPSEVNGLTEVANAFFPRKITGLQTAFRLKDESWTATMNIERLALSVLADTTHLFTVNQGIIYGSSIMHYLISGAPVSTLRIAVPAEYGNVEFAGRDVRNWKKVDSTYEVNLQTPAFGAFTLLTTFDRQFSGKSNTVSFAGATPLDARSEQGTVLVVSEQQLQVKPAVLSTGLVALEPAEISPEHRLLFNAPLLAAYQYSARPFDLQLTLQSLALGETVHQVVDRADLKTQISREGEVVTTARYYVKSQGHSHLQVQLPPDVQLWEATVNNQKVVPVSDKGAMLIPLPARSDPSAIMDVELKIASKSADKKHVKVTAPSLATSVLLTEWTLSPDPKYRLKFRGGNVKPYIADDSGFSELFDLLRYGWNTHTTGLTGFAAFIVIGSLLLRRATRLGVFRGSATHVIAGGLGVLSHLTALIFLIGLISATRYEYADANPGLSLTAPIQTPGQALNVETGNFERDTAAQFAWDAWPAFLGVLVWAFSLIRLQGAGRKLTTLVGWTLVAWAALRLQNGAPIFFGVVFAFAIVHVVIPGLRALWNAPRRPTESAPPLAGPATALILFGFFGGYSALNAEPVSTTSSNVVQVIQNARVSDKFVFVNATLVWKAQPGQKLEFLYAPGVLTRIDYPLASLALSESKTGMEPGYTLQATQEGQHQISFEYQVPVSDTGFVLPTPFGIVNRLTLDIDKPDIEVFSDNAISIQSNRAENKTHAEIVLAPVSRPNIVWRPRPRDPKSEKAVFYGEFAHLLIPSAGVLEGIHDVQIRPAQGQLDEVSFTVPKGVTITDAQSSVVSTWRFDPDRNLLRVQFTQPQSKPFALRLRSQHTAATLPYEQTNGVIALTQAAGQVGTVGIATGGDVQLDTVQAGDLSVINLEDFPAALVVELAPQVPGLTLRRAFRYSDTNSQLTLAASAVRPDVRVETQEILSLGEDRALLSSQLNVHVTRAGIFKLSFVLPREFEVESLTGAALSHWTDLKDGDDRVITMNLRGKTEGDQSFSVTLSGPGTGRRTQWETPRLTIRETTKQSGQLVLVPELGTRLHLSSPEGVSQLDPKKAGVQQKGALAFRLLRMDWRIPFEIETVDPWIQASTLQDVTIREGQALVTVQLDYQIENAGVKAFLLQLPARAENVHFEGDQISDFVRSPGTNTWADWELKLQRRVVGPYSLEITYQMTLSNQAERVSIEGVKAKNANLQRAYVALRPSGRLQIEIPQLPSTLQRTDWQSIPQSLRRNRELAESKDAFSALEPGFELPLNLSRHDVAKVLPARVEKTDLRSVVAPGGEVLTEGRLMIQPGDKRLLRLKLPPDGKFWYAFVNGQSASPWREGDEILLLLEKDSDPNRPTSVEFFYTSSATPQKQRRYNVQLSGPSFDLPLENITWQVSLPENQKVKRWDSSLQLVSDTINATTVDLETYLKNENAGTQARSTEAETMLQMGNSYIQKGTPNQARQAFQSAWKLSPQDAALNEDARVQLHNLKTQQALLGLNKRRLEAFEQFGKPGKVARTPFGRWSPGQAPDYTQQQVQQVLEQNPSEDNSALMKLAERLVSQQDAGCANPEAIRASLPTQGRLLTFTGSLQVKEWASMQIKLDTATEMQGGKASRLLVLIGVLACLAVLAALAPSKKA